MLWRCYTETSVVDECIFEQWRLNVVSSLKYMVLSFSRNDCIWSLRLTHLTHPIFLWIFPFVAMEHSSFLLQPMRTFWGVYLDKKVEWGGEGPPDYFCFLETSWEEVEEWEKRTENRIKSAKADLQTEMLPNNLVHKLDQLWGDISCVT